MRLLASFAATCLALLGTGSLSAADIAAHNKGKPLPNGKHHFVFPAMAKQSISFVSDADEVIAGTIAFPDSGTLGELMIDTTTGTGSGQAAVQVAWLMTGNETRDEHLRSAGWLDAASHPEISFSDVRLERIEGTAYKITGTWTIHGTSQELSSMANVRLVPKMPRVGENLVRVKSSFDLDLKAFGVEHPAVGGPAVAQIWQATITLLGVPKG